jgi:polar amino acid transport system substrate-binding protein
VITVRGNGVYSEVGVLFLDAQGSQSSPSRQPSRAKAGYVQTRTGREDPTHEEEADKMRGSRLWLIVGLLAAFAAAMVVAACGDDDDGDDGETTAGGEDLGLIQEGVLSVGTDTPFPPFEIGQPPNISGYDIDVMNAIAEELGVTAEYTDTGFGTIFRDTANGQYDTAAAASTILKSREKTVDFTDPYYEAEQALLVPEDSDIASVDDLAGLIIGTQDGTTGEIYANEETDAEEVRGYPEGPNAVSALITGQVDAVIIDLPVAVDAIEKQGGVEIVEEIATDELYGFAVAPQNDALREAMNSALTTLKEDGTIADLYEQYFQTEPPPSVTEGTNELLTND